VVELTKDGGINSQSARGETPWVELSE